MLAAQSLFRSAAADPPPPPALPLEVWRLIFDHLAPKELCACACVCSSWRHLIDSLDTRTWRRHFQQRFPWVFPVDWPLGPSRGPLRARYFEEDDSDDEAVGGAARRRNDGGASAGPAPSKGLWRRLFLRELALQRMWRLEAKGREQTACAGVFRRRRNFPDRVRASANPLDMRTLRSAVSHGGAFTTVVLEAGHFEDSSRLELHRPVHLTCDGPLGSVTISVAFVQFASVVRLSNLVLRAPWFTDSILQISEGSIQAENCRFEVGELSVDFADALCFRHCFFERCPINIGRCGPALLENCVLRNPEADCLNINGPACLPRSPICHFVWRQCRQRMPAVPENSGRRVSSEQTAPSFASTPGPRPPSATPKSRASSLPILRSHSFLSSIIRSQRKAKSVSTRAIAEEEEEAEEMEGRGVSDSAEEEEEEENAEEEEDSEIAPEEWSLSGTPEERHLLTRRLLRNFRRRCCHKPRTAALRLPEVRAQLQALAASGVVFVFGCAFQDCHTGLNATQGSEVAVLSSLFESVHCAIRALGNSQAFIFGNRITRCSQSAVIMRNGVRGLVAANSIADVNEAALEVRRRSEPIIVHNRILRSGRCGIVCLTQSNPVIKFNEISRHVETGIHILYKADPIVSSNVISRGKICGIAVSEDGRGNISGNLIAFHDYCGVSVYKLGDPVLRSNYLLSGSGLGVLVREEGSGMIAENLIQGNRRAGVCLHSPFMCQIHGNRICGNEGDGVLVVANLRELEMGEGADEANSGSGSQNRHYFLFDPSDDEEQRWMTWEQKLTLVDHNIIAHNGGAGLLSADNVPMEIRNNSFHDNASHGVCLRLPGLLSSHRVIAQVIGNDVTRNAGCGLQAALTSLLGGRVELVGNGFYGNASLGVQLRLSGRIAENDIVGNGEAALSLEGELQVKICHNRLHASRCPAIRMPAPSSLLIRGIISNNDFFSPLPEPLLTALNCSHFEPRASDSTPAGGSPLRPPQPPSQSPPLIFNPPPLSPGLRGSSNAVRKLPSGGADAWRTSQRLDPPARPWAAAGRGSAGGQAPKGSREGAVGPEGAASPPKGTRRRRMAAKGLSGCGPRSGVCCVL